MEWGGGLAAAKAGLYRHGPGGWRGSLYASSALGGVAERPRTQKSREVPHYFAVMNTSFLECVCGSKPSGRDLHRHGQYPSSTASKSKMPKFSPTSWVPKVLLRGIPSQSSHQPAIKRPASWLSKWRRDYRAYPTKCWTDIL